MKPFSKYIIDPIKNYHQCKFPCIKVTTQFGEIKGQLKDIQNRTFTVFSEKNMLSILPWDKVEIMGVTNIIKNDSINFANDSLSNQDSSSDFQGKKQDKT
jgi:hypothetical protein